LNNSDNLSKPAKSDARFATPRDLAGSHYDEMIRSKEATMAFLSTPHYATRLAAVMICEQNWNAAREARVLEACRAIAESDADESVRLVSISFLGRALSSTKDPAASAFVARMVLESQNSAEFRASAYWVLREIQYGVADVDFDNFLRGTIDVVKTALKGCPSSFSEKSVRSSLLPKPRFPEKFWESADEIDWDFVHQMSKHEEGSS